MIVALCLFPDNSSRYAKEILLFYVVILQFKSDFSSKPSTSYIFNITINTNALCNCVITICFISGNMQRTLHIYTLFVTVPVPFYPTRPPSSHTYLLILIGRHGDELCLGVGVRGDCLLHLFPHPQDVDAWLVLV